MKRVLWILLLVGLCVQCSRHRESVPANQQKTPAPDSRLILQIGTTTFSNDDLKGYLKATYADLSSSDRHPQLLSRLFDLFVERQLVLARARAEGVTVPQAEIDVAVKGLDLKGAAIDPRQLTESMLAQKFLDQRVYAGVVVTDAEVQQYYRNHLDDFRKGDEISLSQIAFDRQHKEKAFAVRAELKAAPEKFDQLAKEAPASPDRSAVGEMGSFERGALPKEVEDVVFSLNPGEISPVVETPFGYHIFKVTKRKRQRLLALSTVMAEIHDQLQSDKVEKALSAFVSALKSDLKPEIHTENLFFSYKSPAVIEETP